MRSVTRFWSAIALTATTFFATLTERNTQVWYHFRTTLQTQIKTLAAATRQLVGGLISGFDLGLSLVTLPLCEHMLMSSITP